MQKRLSQDRKKNQYLIVNIVIAVLLVTFFAATTQAAEPLTFSWLANPADDYIVGYKLYYGSDSRYDANGQLIADFVYDGYYDFGTMERCTIEGDQVFCRYFDQEDADCQDLFGEQPTCTITQQSDQEYFTLTAYNSESESDYTVELYSSLGPDKKVMVGLLMAYRTLLLNNDG